MIGTSVIKELKYDISSLTNLDPLGKYVLTLTILIFQQSYLPNDNANLHPLPPYIKNVFYFMYNHYFHDFESLLN